MRKYILLPSRVGPLLPIGLAVMGIPTYSFFLRMMSSSGRSFRSTYSTSSKGMDLRKTCRICWRGLFLILLNLGAKLSAGCRLPLFLFVFLLLMAIQFLLGQKWIAAMWDIGYFWVVPLNNLGCSGVVIGNCTPRNRLH